MNVSVILNLFSLRPPLIDPSTSKLHSAEEAINVFHFIKHNSAFTINYVALVWKRQEKGHPQQAAGSGMESAAPCDRCGCTNALSHGLSESYSPRIQCSSCISVSLPSLGHGAEMGLELRELHLDTHRALVLHKHRAENISLCRTEPKVLSVWISGGAWLDVFSGWAMCEMVDYFRCFVCWGKSLA